jgi:hypothetical protein
MEKISTALRCDAVAWVGDDFPCWIKVRLVDADGVERVFVDKVPIFTDADLSSTTCFPVPVWARCELLGTEDNGQVLVVSTAPDGLAA